jgi:hypothetical protein
LKGIFVNRTLLFSLILATVAAHSQTREFGVIGGAAVSRGLPIQGAPTDTSAGFQPGVAGGVLLGQDLYNHWGGEIRYLFEQRNPHVAFGGKTASFAGQAHVLYYDLIYNTRSREERVRPYLAVGGGMKLFRGTGAEQAYRPGMEYANLTRVQEMKPMLSVGGGVKWPVGKRMVLRFDVRDQVTPFPSRLIAPAPGMTLKGWLHDFVPTVGLSWRL